MENLQGRGKQLGGGRHVLIWIVWSGDGVVPDEMDVKLARRC